MNNQSVEQFSESLGKNKIQSPLFCRSKMSDNFNVTHIGSQIKSFEDSILQGEKSIQNVNKEIECCK